MAQVSFFIPTADFDRTLNAYAQVSKTEPAKIVIRKAWFIARGACRNTPRVDPERIKHELEASEINMLVLTKRGKFSKNKRATRSYAFRGSTDVNIDKNWNFTQRIFKILAARYRKKGEEIPAPSEFRKEALRMLGARIRSVAFLAAGWLPAIRKLGLYGESRGIKGVKPRIQDKALKTFNNLDRLGRAILQNINSSSAGMSVTITNSANAKHDHKQALLKYGRPALEAAFAAETASTKAEIERRYRENARKLGIRTN